MTVKQLSEKMSLEVLCMPDGDREISGAYCGDLLSWVMAHAKCDNVWITIMSNINTVAVASLTDVSCIILAEGVKPEDEVLKTALEKDINILSTTKSVYETAFLTGELI